MSGDKTRFQIITKAKSSKSSKSSNKSSKAKQGKQGKQNNAQINDKAANFRSSKPIKQDLITDASAAASPGASVGVSMGSAGGRFGVLSTNQPMQEKKPKNYFISDVFNFVAYSTSLKPLSIQPGNGAIKAYDSTLTRTKKFKKVGIRISYTIKQLVSVRDKSGFTAFMKELETIPGIFEEGIGQDIGRQRMRDHSPGPMWIKQSYALSTDDNAKDEWRTDHKVQPAMDPALMADQQLIDRSIIGGKSVEALDLSNSVRLSQQGAHANNDDGDNDGEHADVPVSAADGAAAAVGAAKQPKLSATKRGFRINRGKAAVANAKATDEQAQESQEQLAPAQSSSHAYQASRSVERSGNSNDRVNNNNRKNDRNHTDGDRNNMQSISENAMFDNNNAGKNASFNPNPSSSSSKFQAERPSASLSKRRQLAQQQQQQQQQNMESEGMRASSSSSPAGGGGGTQDAKKKGSGKLSSRSRRLFGNRSTDPFTRFVGRVNLRLNKITLDNFNTLAAQLVRIFESEVNDTRHLEKFVALIFGKTVQEHVYGPLYARLCVEFSSKDKSFDEDFLNKKTNSMDVRRVGFKHVLLRQCQREFMKGKVEPEITAEMDAEDIKNSYIKEKVILLGRMKFIGQLYLHALLPSKIMIVCLRQLIGASKLDDDDVEAACTLLETIGQTLDEDVDIRSRVSNYYNKLRSIERNRKYAPRIRILVRNLLDLRKDKWHNTHSAKKSTLQTKEEIKRDFNRAKGKGGGKGGRGRGGGGSHGGGGGGRQGQQQSMTDFNTEEAAERIIHIFDNASGFLPSGMFGDTYGNSSNVVNESYRGELAYNPSVGGRSSKRYQRRQRYSVASNMYGGGGGGGQYQQQQAQAQQNYEQKQNYENMYEQQQPSQQQQQQESQQQQYDDQGQPGQQQQYQQQQQPQQPQSYSNYQQQQAQQAAQSKSRRNQQRGSLLYIKSRFSVPAAAKAQDEDNNNNINNNQYYDGGGGQQQPPQQPAAQIQPQQPPPVVDDGGVRPLSEGVELTEEKSNELATEYLDSKLNVQQYMTALSAKYRVSDRAQLIGLLLRKALDRRSQHQERFSNLVPALLRQRFITMAELDACLCAFFSEYVGEMNDNPLLNAGMSCVLAPLVVDAHVDFSYILNWIALDQRFIQNSSKKHPSLTIQLEFLSALLLEMKEVAFMDSAFVSTLMTQHNITLDLLTNQNQVMAQALMSTFNLKFAFP